jgi:acetylornithine deacetylase/succinyl-diaminopimelate desuccinylase-like protein
MRRVLEQVETGALTYTPDPAHPFLPRLVVGTISGGGAASSTAERCLAQGDVRFLPGMSVDGMKADLRRIVARVCAETPGLSGRVRTVRYQRSYEMPADAPIVRSIVAAHLLVTGRPPAVTSGLPSGAFITDAADMVRRGIPTAIYGPAAWNTTADEGVAIADLLTAARVYAAACADVVTRRRKG